MRNKKGQFIKGYDKDRGGFKKGHPSYITEKTILKAKERLKINNPMFNKKIKKKYMKIMREKVWNNKKVRLKISNSHKGKKLSNKHKENLRLSHLGHKNSYESKIKNSKKQTELMKIPKNREKRRIARQRQILLNGGGPSIGTNETEILDAFEVFINKNIIRQYSIKGYWVDAYIPKLNTVIEVDERPKINNRDKIRQKEIETELNCNFIRLEDF